jgi:hypothetical protein
MPGYLLLMVIIHSQADFQYYGDTRTAQYDVYNQSFSIIRKSHLPLLAPSFQSDDLIVAAFHRINDLACKRMWCRQAP